MNEYITKDIELNDLFYTVEATVDYSIDHEYGSDRDGNRGISRVFIEDVTLDTVYIEDKEIKVKGVIEDALKEEIGNYFLEQ